MGRRPGRIVRHVAGTRSLRRYYGVAIDGLRLVGPERRFRRGLVERRGCPGRQADRHEVRTQMSRSSIALSNLRAVVIVIVLAFHSVLAYLASLPASRASLRRRALPLAGDPHRRQPALVRLRPVLRLAGRQPDVADVLSVRPVRAVEPGAQGKRHVPVRPAFPDRPAAGPGGRVPDAGDLLPDLSRDRGRSERRAPTGST